MIQTEATLPGVTDLLSQAACKESDTEIFFPISEDEQYVTAARQICGQCVVRLACREFAIANNEQFGIWGGMTTVERNRRRRSRSRSGAAA